MHTTKLILASALVLLYVTTPTYSLPSIQHPFLQHTSPTAQSPLLSAENANTIPSSYIVVLHPHADIDAHHTFLFNTLQSLRQGDGDEVKHVYNMDGFKGYSGTFSEDVLEAIRGSSDVAYVEKDQVVHTMDLQRNAPWGLSRVSHREPLTFRNFNRYLYDPHGGDGVTVYVVDTGINVNHVDFEGRAEWGITVPEGDADEDGNGHGSHVAGTIVGARYGVAKKSKVVAVKVLRSNGSGTMADVVRGVEWVTEAHKAAQASGKKNKGSVANMSLGGGLSKALNAAVNAAVEAGVHFAVAAGNDDADACDYSPASAELAVTVGASTIDDERAWFSNKGKCVDVFAPGKDITSVWIGGKTATNTISGTSMASPHTCGLMAYLLSLHADPENVSPKKMKKTLIELATKDVLTKVPSDTPNLLIFSDPPSQVYTEEQVENMVEDRVNSILGAMKEMFSEMNAVVKAEVEEEEKVKKEDTPSEDDSVEFEWTWV